MAASAVVISVEEYLRRNDKPAFEYKDGELTQKRMPPWKHSIIQFRISELITQLFRNYRSSGELHVCIREGRYLVPDVVVQPRNKIQDPYPTEPLPLCVEVLSPDDRFSEVIAKCEEYHMWGVPMTWIIDPEHRVAWEFANGGRVHEVPAAGAITAGDIVLPVAAIFEALD